MERHRKAVAEVSGAGFGLFAKCDIRMKGLESGNLVSNLLISAGEWKLI